MRFSFAIVLVVVAALTSSTSAAPIEDEACPLDAAVLANGEWLPTN